jgi:hypothetical protein
MGNSSRLFSENRGFGFSECGRYVLPPLSSPFNTCKGIWGIRFEDVCEVECFFQFCVCLCEDIKVFLSWSMCAAGLLWFICELLV